MTVKRERRIENVMIAAGLVLAGWAVLMVVVGVVTDSGASPLAAVVALLAGVLVAVAGLVVKALKQPAQR